MWAQVASETQMNVICLFDLGHLLTELILSFKSVKIETLYTAQKIKFSIFPSIFSVNVT